jgi:hypothetical protein
MKILFIDKNLKILFFSSFGIIMIPGQEAKTILMLKHESIENLK